MRDYAIGYEVLVLPFGAGINDAAIVSGAAKYLPQSLIDFYDGFGTPVVAGTVYRQDADSYEYDVMITDGVTIFRVVGNADPNVAELYRIDNADLVPGITFGGVNGINSAFTLFGTMLIQGNLGGELRLQDGAGFSISQFGTFDIDGVPQGRGTIDRVTSTSDTGNITTEAITLNGNVKTYRDGYAFRWRVKGHYSQSVAGPATVRIRQAGVTGTILGLRRTPTLPTSTATSAALDYDGVFVNDRGSDYTDDIVLTGEASAGNFVVGGSSTAPRVLEVEICGTVAQFPDAPSLT